MKEAVSFITKITCNSCISIRVILCYIFLLSTVFLLSTAYAAKTQTNKVTDLFDRNISNNTQFVNDLQQQNKAATSRVRDTNSRKMIEGASNTDSKIRELNSIRVTDLPNAGRTKRTEYRFYDENELEPDYTKSGNRMHQRDAERISNASNKVMNNLMGKLKDVGIDCHTVKGSTHKEPIFFIDIKKESQRNTKYNQLFCEEPRNKYNCTDTVSLRCTRPSSTPELLNITGANFKHRVKGNMMYMDHSYSSRSSEYHTTSSGLFRVDALFGKTQEKRIGACTAYLTMTFNVKDDLSTIAEFALLNLSHTGPVMIRLNNQLVHSYPSSTTHLSFDGQYDIKIHKRGNIISRKKYVTHHPMVNINGESKLLSGYIQHIGSWFSRARSPNNGTVNLKPFLRHGRNELQITAISLNSGKVTAQMRSMKKLCLQWQETWDERCVIR